MNDFADKLKELMEEKDIDIKTLAEHLELSGVARIYEWLKGEKSFLLPSAVRIADYFGCSLDYLFGRSDDYGNDEYKTCPPFDVQFRKVINEQNISQNKLLKDKVIGRGNLNCWLNKKQRPHIESIIKIADYLKVSMDYLVGREK